MITAAKVNTIMSSSSQDEPSAPIAINLNIESDRVQKIKEARQDVLQAPIGHESGDILAPSPYTILPGRCTNDLRLHKHPAALITLMTLCSYSNAYTGTCYPSQERLAKRLGKSQQAVSKQIKLLVEWGYIEILRRGSSLRKKNRTSLYRIVYDPKANVEDIMSKALHQDEQMQREEAQVTMDKIIKPVDNFSKEPKHTTPRGCTSTQPPEVVNELTTITNKNIYKENIKEEANKICKEYASLLDKILGTRGEWRWDERQVNAASQLIESGVTLQQFTRRVSSSLKWHKKNHKRPPFSLLFFKDAFKERKEVKEMTPEEIINDTVKNLRISKLYKS